MKLDEDGHLLCPACGGDNLHHYRIEVFDRDDDDVNGQHVVVEGRKTIIDKDMANNPSSRRDGLRIFFWCEGCRAKSTLEVYQHKGVTFTEHSNLIMVVGDTHPIRDKMEKP